MHVVLVAPEIPQNTGSIGRLCVAMNAHLHLVDPLGFVVDDKHVRRAGLDYWSHVRLTRHASWDAFVRDRPPGTLRFFTTHAERSYADVRYEPTDLLVFGCESVGLPASIRAAYRTSMHAIPIDSPYVRSLNLATAAAVVLYEARRQLGPLP